MLTQVGGRFALPPTGVVLVLLAHAPAVVQEQVLAAPLHRYTLHTVVDPGQLRRVPADARRAGHAVSDRQVTDDAVSVAAPVWRSGEVVRPFAAGVMAAARGISRELGA